ncbi:hypothetical protein C8R45DRAFT_1026282 [Mycena sanguinolenta]|nr:hypothetical protein C8R45DRAFT_1026282 [Mycena sanguinolenta]
MGRGLAERRWVHRARTAFVLVLRIPLPSFPLFGFSLDRFGRHVRPLLQNQVCCNQSQQQKTPLVSNPRKS